MELNRNHSTKGGGSSMICRILDQTIEYTWVCGKLMTTFTILGAIGLVAAIVLIMGLAVTGLMAIFVGRHEKKIIDTLKKEKKVRNRKS